MHSSTEHTWVYTPPLCVICNSRVISTSSAKCIRMCSIPLSVWVEHACISAFTISIWLLRCCAYNIDWKEIYYHRVCFCYFFFSASFTSSSACVVIPLNNRLDQDPSSHVWYLTCAVCYGHALCASHRAMSGIQVECARGKPPIYCLSNERIEIGNVSSGLVHYLEGYSIQTLLRW